MYFLAQIKVSIYELGTSSPNFLSIQVLELQCLAAFRLKLEILYESKKFTSGSVIIELMNQNISFRTFEILSASSQNSIRKYLLFLRGVHNFKRQFQQSLCDFIGLSQRGEPKIKRNPDRTGKDNRTYNANAQGVVYECPPKSLQDMAKGSLVSVHMFYL